MVDIAQLGFDIRSESAVKAEGDLDRMTAASRRAEDQTQDLTQANRQAEAQLRRTAASTQGAARAAVAGGGGFRMLGMQLSQVAQQGAVTGNYLGALSVQAADIGIAFGTIGIVAGAAISVLGPLALSYFDVGEEAETASERTDKFVAALDTAMDMMERSQMSLGDLRAEFGDFADEMRDLSTYLADVAVGRAIDSFSTSTAQMVEDLGAAVARAEELSIAIDTINAAGLETDRSMVATIEELRASADEAAEALGLTSSQAVALDEALNAVQAQDSLIGIRDSAKEALDVIRQMFPEGQKLPPELASAVTELERIVGAAARATTAIGESSAAAAGLANNLAVAASVQFARDNMQYSGRGGDPRQFTDDSRFNPSQDVIDATNRMLRGGRTGGGGGGMSDAQREHNELLREAERIIKATRTPLETFNAETERLTKLLDGGYISQETYNRALEDAEEQLNETARALEASISGELTSAFRAAAEGADVLASATEAMNNILLKAAEDLFNSRIANPLASGISGFLDGVIDRIGNINAAPRAMGGPVSAGKPYLVGERGPELFIPGGNGSISNKVSPSLNVQVINQAGVDVEVDQRGDTTEILLKRVEERIAGSVTGGGKVGQAMNLTYGLRPKTARR